MPTSPPASIPANLLNPDNLSDDAGVRPQELGRVELSTPVGCRRQGEWLLSAVDQQDAEAGVPWGAGL